MASNRNQAVCQSLATDGQQPCTVVACNNNHLIHGLRKSTAESAANYNGDDPAAMYNWLLQVGYDAVGYAKVNINEQFLFSARFLVQRKCYGHET